MKLSNHTNVCRYDMGINLILCFGNETGEKNFKKNYMKRMKKVYRRKQNIHKIMNGVKEKEET